MAQLQLAGFRKLVDTKKEGDKMSYGDKYNDRGIVKWAGFYLSEQTETLEHDTHTERNRPKQKMQMDMDEIGERLTEARLKSKLYYYCQDVIVLLCRWG
ncbi:hypothetical protein ACFC67_15550 [Enterococcus gallinarum]